MSHRVFIHALGLLNAAGTTPLEVARHLFAETYPETLTAYDQLYSGKKTFVGKVKQDLPEIPKELSRYQCRNNQLLLAAFQQIAAKYQQMTSHVPIDRIGIVIGTSTSGILEGEEAFKEFSKDGIWPVNFSYSQQEIGNASVFLGDYLGVQKYRMTISTACSSSARAFISAKRLLDSDLCDVVLVGGSDSLCELTLNGFDCLESIANGLTRPMSRNRDGINIGEGAALFILSKEKSDVEFLGYGESSDGYHISAPHPEGAGACVALSQALTSAGCEPHELGYVNLHGTGTPKNDIVESKVMTRLFPEGVPCSSTKPIIGHTLGAAGAQEVAFCYLVVSKLWNPEGKLPIHFWDYEQDPELPRLHFVTAKDRIVRRICMSNNFAFGGNNVSLIIGEAR